LAYKNYDFNNYTEEGDFQSSKVNAGQLIIFRLNSLWNNVIHYWRTGQDDKLAWELDMIWFELSADVVKKELEEYERLNQELNKAKTIQDLVERRKRVFNALSQKWMFLKRIEKHQGLGKTYRDPTEDELD
jgi:hypothetical protein